MDYVLTSNGSPFTKCPNPTMLKPLQMLAKSCKNRSMCDHVWSDVGAVPSFVFCGEERAVHESEAVNLVIDVPTLAYGHKLW